MQYEIDTPLHEFSALIGDQHAARAYHLCQDAINELAACCDKLPDRAEFERHPSLWYASYKKDIAGLIEPEFRARKRHGFRVRLLGEQDVRETFGFSAPGGILSAVGATCHPYKLTSSLMNAITHQGGVVHDLTEVTGWSATRNQVVLDTKRGPRIKAKYVVVAAGYESQDYLPKNVTRFHSTYAIVSKPVSKRAMWYRNSLLWETKSPYLYLRTTADGRVLLGGRDENFQSAGKRERPSVARAGSCAPTSRSCSRKFASRLTSRGQELSARLKTVSPISATRTRAAFSTQWGTVAMALRSASSPRT